jgi:hypothetical protein
MTAPSFTCPRCGAVSRHPADAAAGYCGRCHDFTGRAAAANRRAVAEVLGVPAELLGLAELAGVAPLAEAEARRAYLGRALALARPARDARRPR